MISIANITQPTNVTSSFQDVHYQTSNVSLSNIDIDIQNVSFRTNTNASFDNYTEYAEVPNYIKATSMTFCIVIMCLGVIGNIMVPIVILKTKDMRNSTNIFLVNLSIADLMVLLVCTPTVLVEVNSKPETWVLGKELCLAVPFVELTVAHASVLTILAISFERYYAICEPLRAGYVCTKTRATLICALAWFFAALFTSPILGIAEHHPGTREDGSTFYQCLTQAVTYWQIAFFVMVIIFLYILPLIILIVLYSVIAKNLISAASKVVMNKTVDPYNVRARKQVILMLGTVVLCFFLCLMPYRILALWIIVTPTELSQEISPEKWYNILYFSRIMLYINSAINPILYNLMSSKFRIGFCKVCICYKKSKERIQNRAQRTVTNGSTTSSSLSRTTNSLKKLFSHRKSLERSDMESDKSKDAVSSSKPNNLLDRIFTNKTFLRQQSAPEYENPKENSILRMKSEGNVNESADNIEEDVKQSELQEVNVKIYHSSRKFSDFDHNHSLRRSVLINSVKSKSMESEGSHNFVYKKVKVDCVVGFQQSGIVNQESPESFV